MVLKQLGAGPELVHCHATLKLDALMTSAVTLVGVGGSGGGTVVQNYNCYTHYKCLPLAGRLTILGTLLVLFGLPLA